MGFRVDELTIQGFRGINEKVSLRFGDGVTLLFGENGAGKTSILQAAEWALTGRLPYLSGPDFSKEDAIVNMFRGDRTCRVELRLAQGGREVSCVRSRKGGKSTTRRTSDLRVETDGKTAEGSEASAQLEGLLGIPMSDFSKVSYLHQESIRELLSLDPRERSEAIDRLLGTLEVRELAEVLDARRLVAAREKYIRERIDALNRDKVQFAVNMRARTNKRREEMLRSGYAALDLTLQGLAGEVSSLSSDLRALGAKYGEASQPAPAEHPADLPGAEGAIRGMEASVRDLDRRRLHAYGEMDKRRGEIIRSLEDVKEAEAELASVGPLSPEALGAQVQEAAGALAGVEPRLTELNRSLTNLVALQGKLSSSRVSVEGFEKRAKEILSKYGEEEQLQTLQTQYERDLASTKTSIEAFSKLSQLLSLASDYIALQHPETCPVCDQKVESGSVLRALEKKSDESVPSQLVALRTSQRELDQKLSDVRSNVDELRRIRGLAAYEQKRSEEALEEVSHALGEKVGEQEVGGRVEALKAEMRQLSEKSLGLRALISELEEKGRRAERASKKKQEAERALQALLGSTSSGDTLRDEGERAVSEIARSMEVYRATTEIDGAYGRTKRLDEVLGYLKAEEEVREIERELPRVTDLLGRLEGAKAELDALAGSLGAIRLAALSYEEEAVVSELASLGELINVYYARILGHPTFSRISLVIEKREPLIYSVRAEGSEGSTYIPTRFSHAQMNCVAIVLFLANNEKLGGGLSTLMIDDPTQGMDAEHKKALASVVAEIAREKGKQVIVASQDSEFQGFLAEQVSGLRTVRFGGWSTEGPALTTSP
jgi:exonuclease SbcC